MNKQISINRESCTKCRRCIRVCPSKLFTQNEQMDIEVSADGCIACGHCVAACQSDSVCHSDFPESAIHKIDYAQMPTPEQVMLLCKVRRSNRAFSKKEIGQDIINKIVEAAHRAPTASNSQSVSFTIVTDPAKIRIISDFTIGVFHSVVRKLTNPLLKPIIKAIVPSLYGYVPLFERIEAEYKKGNDMILRGATAIILIHTPSEGRFGAEDANLAYQNGSLMAESLGISQFYTGFVCSAIKQKHYELEKLLGISGTIRAGMALGVPSFRMENYIDKNEAIVNVL